MVFNWGLWGLKGLRAFKVATVRLGDPDFFFFQSTPFALKLRGHFINISMMILAKGILITRPATLFFLETPRCLHTAVRTFDTAQLFILKTVQNTSSEAKMCI